MRMGQEDRDVKKFKKFASLIDYHLKKEYGKRCEDYEPNCPICSAWVHRDVFLEHFKPYAGLDLGEKEKVKK